MLHQNSIYFDRGGGGLCRMRALNAFFGNFVPRQVMDSAKFHQYIQKYDQYLKSKFNVQTSSAAFDLVNSDQTNLVSWVLREHGIFAKYYSLNEIYGKPLPEYTFLFVYNSGHIWAVIKKDKYYKIDNGVSPFNYNSLWSTKNIGVIIPLPLKKEYIRRINNINKIYE